MKKTKQFNNILNECLERVLLRGGAIEECLSRHPEQAAELEPLLRMALAARQATAIAPRAEFRDRARRQFRMALQEKERVEERRASFLSWQPRWATAVITVLVLLLAGGGTVAAASNSMPDEPLYQVKLATEAVQLALTPSAVGKAELYIKLTDRRVAEIVEMADKGKPEEVEKAAERLDSQLVAMTNLNLPAGEPRQEKAGTLMAPTPAAAPRQATEETPSVAKQAPENEKATAIPPPRIEVTAPTSKETSREDRVGKESKEDRLKAKIEQRAEENPKILRDALEKAPESVKDTLRRAIDKSDKAYQKARESLDR